jgi:hypothetical protein
MSNHELSAPKPPAEKQNTLPKTMTKLEEDICALIEKCRRFDRENPGPYDKRIPGNLHLFEVIADELETGILPVMRQELAAAEEAARDSVKEHLCERCIEQVNWEFQDAQTGALARHDAALTARVLEAQRMLRAQFADLAVEMEKHSNDHIHDDDPAERLGAAVEGVCADRINAILSHALASSAATPEPRTKPIVTGEDLGIGTDDEGNKHWKPRTQATKGTEMDGLLMKYFVLKPKGIDLYAQASRRAMRTYAAMIERDNETFANELRTWADAEYAQAIEDGMHAEPGDRWGA